MIEIKVTKASLYLTEKELFDNLPKDLLVTALKRGKAFKRAAAHKRRGREKHDREE